MKRKQLSPPPVRSSASHTRRNKHYLAVFWGGVIASGISYILFDIVLPAFITGAGSLIGSERSMSDINTALAQAFAGAAPYISAGCLLIACGFLLAYFVSKEARR